jgi:hypothetical protein
MLFGSIALTKSLLEALDFGLESGDHALAPVRPLLDLFAATNGSCALTRRCIGTRARARG